MDKKSEVYIIMGVSGCGKTCIGGLLAAALNLPFYDGDDFHPASNIQKMENGMPLNDSDRKPWLELLNNYIQQWNVEGGAVLACSALKAKYRYLLSQNARVVFIYLQSTKERILDRLNKRQNHFMPSSLLDSQFATLEEPRDALYVDNSPPPTEVIETLLLQLNAGG